MKTPEEHAKTYRDAIERLFDVLNNLSLAIHEDYGRMLENDAPDEEIQHIVAIGHTVSLLGNAFEAVVKSDDLRKMAAIEATYQSMLPREAQKKLHAEQTAVAAAVNNPTAFTAKGGEA